MKIADFGPFGSAVMAAVIPAGLLVTLGMGLRIDFMSVLSVLVPGMALAVILVSVSIAWIFILYGRLKRTPRWLPGVFVANGVAMLELLALVIWTGKS